MTADRLFDIALAVLFLFMTVSFAACFFAGPGANRAEFTLSDGTHCVALGTKAISCGWRP